MDEAHHATAASYRAILGRFGCARVLGCTATPDRLDRAALGEVFESVAFQYELRDAIRDGWLCRIDARRVLLAVDLDRVHTRAGDLDQSELAQVLGTASAVREVVEPLLELAGERRTILFTVSVAHAEQLAAAINEREPGAARAASGDTPSNERREVVEAFRQGELRTLVNCQLYTEGFDVPEVECIAIARPTKSRALYAQMVGRGTRLAAGKESLLVIDFTGNSRRHRLVTPAAILAGADATPDELLAAAAIEGDVMDALALARADQLELARRSPARVRFWAEVVDLFDMPQPDLDGGPLATARQRDALERAGLSPPADLTRAAASTLIDRLVARRKRGLCTPRAGPLPRPARDRRSRDQLRRRERAHRPAPGWLARPVGRMIETAQDRPPRALPGPSRRPGRPAHPNPPGPAKRPTPPGQRAALQRFPGRQAAGPTEATWTDFSSERFF